MSLRVLIPLILVLSPHATAAGVYKWYDESGRVNYTQTLPPKTAVRFERPGGHINVIEQNWSPAMKHHVQKFMNDAKVR